MTDDEAALKLAVLLAQGTGHSLLAAEVCVDAIRDLIRAEARLPSHTCRCVVADLPEVPAGLPEGSAGPVLTVLEQRDALLARYKAAVAIIGEECDPDEEDQREAEKFIADIERLAQTTSHHI